MVSRAQKTGQTRKAGLETPFTIRPTRAARSHVRTCDWQGCSDEGEFRTHRSPREMGSHVWYCAEHIRDHNKAWNYFDGLSDDEVEAVIKNDTVWQRPTWELGSKADKAKAKAFADGARIQDNFGFFNDASDKKQNHNRAFPPDSPRSEEHTSELQSLRHLVCRLLLEKKKKNKQLQHTQMNTLKQNKLT